MYRLGDDSIVDPEIDALISQHVATGVRTPLLAAHPCTETNSCDDGGGGDNGYWVDTITTYSGTGYDPFTGGTYDAWAFWTNSWSYVSTGISYSGPSGYDVGTWYWNTFQKKPATCAIAHATIVGGVVAAAQYMVRNPQTFSTIIRVGASSGAASALAQQFAALGPAVTLAGAIAFLTAIVIGLPAEAIVALALGVTTFVVILATATQCFLGAE